MTDGEHPQAETPMQRFEDLLGRIVSVTKEDVKKPEEVAEKVIDEALGPPPAGGPAIPDEDD